jgi:hypothetical protein
LTLIGSRLFIQSSTHLPGKEWVGMFISLSDTTPVWVVQGATIPTGCTGSQLQVLTVPTSVEMYSVLPTSRILVHIPQSQSLTVSCFLDKVRVETVTRGPEQTKILLFYGKISALYWDPGCVQWSNAKPFLAYTTKMDREFLCNQRLVPHFSTLRWSDSLPSGSTFR